MTLAEIDFASIYRAHLDYVWSTLRRLGVAPRDLEDLAHEVFLVVHRRLADYDRERPMRPWLFGIAYRIASDDRKKTARRGPHDDSGDALASQQPSPEGETLQREAIGIAQRALAAIDDEARAVFILAELDGVAVTEVAETLSIPVNTAYTRLRRARLAVASALTGGAA